MSARSLFLAKPGRWVKGGAARGPEGGGAAVARSQCPTGLFHGAVAPGWASGAAQSSRRHYARAASLVSRFCAAVKRRRETRRATQGVTHRVKSWFQSRTSPWRAATARPPRGAQSGGAQSGGSQPAELSPAELSPQLALDRCGRSGSAPSARHVPDSPARAGHLARRRCNHTRLLAGWLQGSRSGALASARAPCTLDQHAACQGAQQRFTRGELRGCDQTSEAPSTSWCQPATRSCASPPGLSLPSAAASPTPLSWRELRKRARHSLRATTLSRSFRGASTLA